MRLGNDGQLGNNGRSGSSGQLRNERPLENGEPSGNEGQQESKVASFSTAETTFNEPSTTTNAPVMVRITNSLE